MKVSFPKTLYDEIAESVGSEKVLNICEILNQQAPVTLRVNPLKIGRDELFRRFKTFKGLNVQKTKYSPLGIQFLQSPSTSLYETQEFKKGYFEIQDEASQLVAF